MVSAWTGLAWVWKEEHILWTDQVVLSKMPVCSAAAAAAAVKARTAYLAALIKAVAGGVSQIQVQQLALGAKQVDVHPRVRAGLWAHKPGRRSVGSR